MTDRDRDARDVERLLSRHEPPAPGDALRRQILGQAAATVEASAPLTVTERIWLSRSWRLGWAAALALLLLGQLVMVRSASRSLQRLLGQPRDSTRTAGDPAVSMAEFLTRELGIEAGGSMVLTSSIPRPRPQPRSPLTELPPEE